MYFNKHSKEQLCGSVIPGSDKGVYADCGGIACMRTAGHKGKHIATTRDAALADGVCFGCREPIGKPHQSDCFKSESAKSVGYERRLKKRPGQDWLVTIQLPDANEEPSEITVFGVETEMEAVQEGLYSLSVFNNVDGCDVLCVEKL